MGTVPYVFIGDDFTGASDTLATLAERDWSTRLFLETSALAAAGADELDAAGFATELRSLSPAEITAQLNRLLPAISALSPAIIHYKVCSTFDSAVHTGNIATAVSLLERHFSPSLTLVLGGQPSLGRYCSFGNLFARASDGHTYRIDRHPVMKCHPITPMPEADLRLHLAEQGLSGLELVSLPEIAKGAKAIASALDKAVGSGRRRFLLDVTDEEHLASIRMALHRFQAGERPILVVGASSVGEIFAGAGKQRPVSPSGVDSRGSRETPPTLVVAGSRSAVTAAQVASAASFRKLPVSADGLSSGLGLSRLSEACRTLLHQRENVLVHLLREEDYGLTGTEISRRLAEFVSGMLAAFPVKNLGLAGGDTSSIIARNIGLTSLSFERRIGSGTAVCRASFPDGAREGLRILFKGGQVGPENVFDQFALSHSLTGAAENA